MKQLIPSNLHIWPAFLPIKGDELFTSWLIRMAHNHGMEYKAFYSTVLPEFLFNKQNPDIKQSDNILKQLSKFTCRPITQIKKSLLNEALKDWIITYSYFNLLSRTRGIMCCPGCLLEDKNAPYFRKNWLLAYVFYCEIHQCFLFDKCPKCKAKIMLNKVRLSKKIEESKTQIARCYHCNFLFSNIRPKTPHQNNKIAEVQIAVKKAVISPKQRQKMLTMISVLQCRKKEYITFSNKISKHIGLKFSEKSRRINTLNIKERYPYLAAAVWLIQNKPKELPGLIKRLKINRRRYGLSLLIH
jgi:hypothetical protein